MITEKIKFCGTEFLAPIAISMLKFHNQYKSNSVPDPYIDGWVQEFIIVILTNDIDNMWFIIFTRYSS